MATSYVHDRYLDAEERYEVLVVKAAERPHLVRWTAADAPDSDDGGKRSGGAAEDGDEEKKVDDARAPPSPSMASQEHTVEPLSPPLTDGCDLPGWRCQRIAPCMNAADEECSVDIESPLEGTLHIGAGSSLMRRESQLPFISSSLCGGVVDKCWWRTAKESFNTPPPPERAAPVIEHQDAARLVDCIVGPNKEIRQLTLFCKEYEVKNYPVKILGATAGWAAMPRYELSDDTADDQTAHEDQDRDHDSWRDVGESSKLMSGGGKGGWTFANLLSRFGNISFRFSDTHGEMMALHTYAKYITNPEGLSDDSPLGIYDSEFGDAASPTSVLLEEYSVPSCFSPDLFDMVDEGAVPYDDEEDTEDEDEDENATISRPPYRWILIGPERSGTGMHVDPLWTNAWVTVLQGRKRWLLFPPDTPYESIGMIDGRPQIPSSIWFRDYYDKVTSPSWPKEYRPVEVLQYPGETVYVPAGWPHLVLNLELTVAVTHNYASEHGPFFERMWKEVAEDEPAFATRWYAGLRKCGREDLARRAPQDIWIF